MGLRHLGWLLLRGGYLVEGGRDGYLVEVGRRLYTPRRLAAVVGFASRDPRMLLHKTEVDDQSGARYPVA